MFIIKILMLIAVSGLLIYEIYGLVKDFKSRKKKSQNIENMEK